MALDALNGLNIYATFRFALSYPGEQHTELFRQISADIPETLADFRSLHILLFEAGLPHPKCPLLESHYVENRPAPAVVLENKLFYQHFGLRVLDKAAPDHLLTQFEFLSWLDHCLESGNSDRDSIRTAKEEFLDRHVRHWLPKAAELTKAAAGRCYADLFAAIVDSLRGDTLLHSRLRSVCLKATSAATQRTRIRHRGL